MLGSSRTALIAGKLGLNPRRSLVAARALSHPHELDRLVQWFSYLDRPDLAALLPGLGWSDEDWTGTMDAQRSALRRASGWSPLARMQIVDCLTWLPGNMLERGDRMTMAEGLEARPPFLDTRLAAFGLALPDRVKVRLRSGKWIVRAMGQTLPADCDHDAQEMGLPGSARAMVPGPHARDVVRLPSGRWRIVFDLRRHKAN